MGLWAGASATKYTGFVSGIVFIVSGILALAAASAIRQSKSNAMCLAITALVMGIISSLLAFGLLVWYSLLVDAYRKVSVILIVTAPAAIVSTELAFQIIVLFASIAVAMFSGKSITEPTAATIYRAP
ncbi:uncharacterized protein LOC129601688 isoform X2 [Paramacrobiotus metropolitanus]|nr:uncharacterized protein LOC129601688 isoform X2 [Paramacrobiotus metropolitanus]